MSPITNPPGIVRAAEDRAACIKKLHAALVAGDKDNQRRARQLGELLEEEKDECIRTGCLWGERLAELGIQPRTANNCRAIAKGYRVGLLSESDSDLGYSEALIKVRVARRRAKAAKAAAADGGGVEAGEGAGRQGPTRRPTRRPSADHTREYRIPFKRKDYPAFADLVRLAMKRSGKDRPGVMMDAVDRYVKELSNG
jgi:hypothetical protein